MVELIHDVAFRLTPRGLVGDLSASPELTPLIRRLCRHLLPQGEKDLDYFSTASRMRTAPMMVRMDPRAACSALDLGSEPEILACRA